MREVELPGYELLENLGAGGFGEVMLARHRALGRLVAVKRLRSFARDDDGALERFRREARVLAMLDCPQIVGVYDFRCTGGDALLVMEYVPGRPLDDLLPERALTAVQLVRVLADVAAALESASARGIVHRDVKPANVFVLPDGSAKLGDFGLARITGDSAAFRTAAGLVTGTPAYLAPEVTAGGEPDLRSDAYSFAVLAYECLVGRLPFDCPSIHALAAAHAYRQPPRPSEFVSGFPSDAERGLLDGLAKDPAARPLPGQLAARLPAAEDWPQSEDAPSERSMPRPRAAPTLFVRPASPAPPLPQQPPAVAAAAATGRRGRRAGILAAAAAGGVGLVVTVGVVLAGSGPSRSAGPPAVPAVELSVIPTSVRCPAGSVLVTADLQTSTGGGRLDLRWTQPDGRPAPPAALDLAPGSNRATATLRFDITGGQPLRGVARLAVVDPATGRQLAAAVSPEVDYRCP